MHGLNMAGCGESDAVAASYRLHQAQRPRLQPQLARGVRSTTDARQRICGWPSRRNGTGIDRHAG